MNNDELIMQIITLKEEIEKLSKLLSKNIDILQKPPKKTLIQCILSYLEGK